MKIQRIKNLYINFNSRKLYSAKLHWKSKTDNSTMPEDVFVSQINYDDLTKLSRQEQIKIREDWGNRIIDELQWLPEGEYEKDGTRFFAIEAPTANGTKIRGLAMTTTEKFGGEKVVYINFLQSYKETPHWTIHGAGSCLIYGIIDSFARKNGMNAIALHTVESATNFYKKLGFQIPLNGGWDFEIRKKNFKKVKPLIQQKYSIKKLMPEETKVENKFT